jgi:glyoxylase-like metal-dependent hydrolase (beta-lactamase superfamily II)
MLDAMRSQPVAGSQGTSIYPYIRKIDLMSSNSYIISGHEQIAVIDPGGLDEQIDHLEGVVELLQEEMLRPVVIYLTHVHMDHWIQLKQGTFHRNLNEAALAVQAAGAEALEKQDCGITLSGLLGRPMIQVPVDLKLLAPWDLSLGGEYHMRLDGWTTVICHQIHGDLPGLTLHSQIIPRKGDCLEIISHSGA